MTRVFASILATLALIGATWLAGVAQDAADMTRPAVTAAVQQTDTYNGGQ